MNGPIVEAVPAQRGKVIEPQRVLLVGHLGRKRAKGTVGIRQGGLSPVAGHRVREDVRLGCGHRTVDLGPEVVRVGLRSVTTVQLGGNDGGQ